MESDEDLVHREEGPDLRSSVPEEVPEKSGNLSIFFRSDSKISSADSVWGAAAEVEKAAEDPADTMFSV